MTPCSLVPQVEFIVTDNVEADRDLEKSISRKKKPGASAKDGGERSAKRVKASRSKRRGKKQPTKRGTLIVESSKAGRRLTLAERLGM